MVKSDIELYWEVLDNVSGRMFEVKDTLDRSTLS